MNQNPTEEPAGENIPLTPVGGSTWEPEHEQETSFGGGSQRTKLMKEYAEGCIERYLKEGVKPQENLILIILNSKMGNCTTKVVTSS